MERFEDFLELAKTRIARLGYMVWDIYTCPDIMIIDNFDESYRCTYDLHTTIFGPPNNKIIKNFNPKGEFSLSFDLKWEKFIRSNFTDFIPMDKSVKNKDMNTFLCMELKKENFTPKEEYISRELHKKEEKLLGIKRRILFSQGLGGVGIVEKNELIGCAFAPHFVLNNKFSFAIIRAVWVNKSHRNKGLGLDLSSHICNKIFNTGINLVSLWVEETNLPAVKIYEKLGFKTIEKVFGTDCKKIET